MVRVLSAVHARERSLRRFQHHARTVQRLRDHVVEITDAANALPPDVRPTVIVGGYPVKAGLIEAIPAAELLSDISALPIS